MKTPHDQMMLLAIEEADKAASMDEVPVGAVLTDSHGHILASGHNETITRCDPTAHAEILVLRDVANKIQNYRLLGTTLYVTVEPCVMCLGAIIHARVTQIVFGTRDPKWGAAGSLYDFTADSRFNHRPEIVEGILADQCRKLMRDFFAGKRKKARP